MSEFRLTESVTPNFHQAVIAYHDHQVAVVALRDSAVLAVAEPRVIDDAATESGPLTFIGSPDLVAALAEQSGFEILTSAELAQPFDAAAWPELDRHDIRHWKPQTVGEALFNYWD
ncbi:Uncharacterised protein [Nocardia otitidiscaviarum]|uniref:Uncharacterized protein n=1 Tax=Nocardia otitidiscaviarum TaxID=1823 RepID=A0A378YAT9_9NOCA|nr:Uncharacterised protein [Nocardia otitidiscaviarum]